MTQHTFKVDGQSGKCRVVWDDNAQQFHGDHPNIDRLNDLLERPPGAYYAGPLPPIGCYEPKTNKADLLGLLMIGLDVYKNGSTVEKPATFKDTWTRYPKGFQFKPDVDY